MALRPNEGMMNDCEGIDEAVHGRARSNTYSVERAGECKLQQRQRPVFLPWQVLLVAWYKQRGIHMRRLSFGDRRRMKKSTRGCVYLRPS